MTTMVRSAIVLIAMFQADAVRAQTPPGGHGFLDVNAGLAVESGTIETSRVFSLFGESGAVATSVAAASGALADIRVGARVGPRFGVAIAAAGGRSEAVGRATASVPSPVRFASPSIVALDAPGLKRREVGYHLQALWFRPVSEKITLAVFGGPSLIHLQQAIAGIAVDGGSPVVTAANETGTGLGGNVGVDIAYLWTRRFGVGLVVRYAAASVNLPSADAVKVGGAQAGGGIRIRF
jgi:hypothetical protein